MILKNNDNLHWEILSLHDNNNLNKEKIEIDECTKK